MEDFLTIGAVILLIAVSVIPYVLRMKKKERAAREAMEAGKLMSGGPQAQHPHIDTTTCIGCGTCVASCPEGDVLAVIGGKAAIINGYKCIGHGLCAEACPVGAIEIVMASPSASADTPMLTEHYETNVPGLYIVGELGGLALIKNAVNQGRDCVTYIAGRLRAEGITAAPEVYDLLVVGAGPAGISASLTAIQHKLRYVTLEQDDIGGTVSQYPRQKLVMTSPVELPTYGKFKKLEITKEELLEFWKEVFAKAGLQVRTQEKVQEVRRTDGLFEVVSTRGSYRARAVVLALGKRGTPRKLGVLGEKLDKVYYRLIEADHYMDCHILIVGGGDSAVEAAMGLAVQKGNRVILSYRGETFTRIKDRNAKRLQKFQQEKTLEVIMSSSVKEIRPETVLLEHAGGVTEIRNDYVWVFAGGESPNSFLQKAGVQIGQRDVTAAAA